MVDRAAPPVSRRLLAAAVLAALLTGCVPASPDTDTYDDKVRLTLGSAVGEVRTVERLLQTLHEDRMLRPTAVAQLRYGEDSLGTATKALTELNPPPGRDRLADRADTLLTDADDAMAAARLAVERSQVDAYPRLARDLERVAVAMEQVEERLR